MKKLSQEILVIAILTLTIVLVWIYLSLYTVLGKPNEKPLLTPSEIKVINPEFDESVFNELEKRKL